MFPIEIKALPCQYMSDVIQLQIFDINLCTTNENGSIFKNLKTVRIQGGNFLIVYWNAHWNVANGKKYEVSQI